MTAGALELGHVDGWLDQLFHGDDLLTALVGNARPAGTPDGIPFAFAFRAGDDTPEPFVVWAPLSPLDVRPAGRGRLAVSATYTVRTVVAGDHYLPGEPIAERVDALLEADAQVAGWAPDDTSLCWSDGRQSPVLYPETVNGQTYWHMGGIYRLWCQNTA